MDGSNLVGIPPLFQACWLANQNATNHTHADSKHSHDGIYRHGESHGFARFTAELRPTAKDRIALNSITVFPENESPQWGYAAAIGIASQNVSHLAWRPPVILTSTENIYFTSPVHPS